MNDESGNGGDRTAVVFPPYPRSRARNTTQAHGSAQLIRKLATGINARSPAAKEWQPARRL